MIPSAQLPGIGIELSRIGFGCWAIGGEFWGDDVDDRQSADAIEAALELGVNWFDTAPLYGRGHADRVLTDALGSRRHDVVVATKVGTRIDEATGHALSDLSPEHIVSDCEASLRRLRLDRIPLLQVHWPCDRGTPLAASLEALVSLRDRGKISAIGLCNYDARSLAEARALAPVVSLQTPLSMVRRAYLQQLAPACAPADGPPRVGVLAYETLCRGLLTGKFGPEPPWFPESDLRARDDRFSGRPYAAIAQLNRALSLVATKVGVPQSALAVAWVLRQPGVTAAIVGTKRAAQIRDTIRATELLGRPAIWAALDPFVDRTRV